MSNRLDQDRQSHLEPKRMESTMEALRGIEFFVPIVVSHNEIHIFNMKTQNIIKFWPYSGWHTGKDIEDGRGFEHLIKQLKTSNDTYAVTNDHGKMTYPRKDGEYVIRFNTKAFSGGFHILFTKSPWWAFWRKK